MPIKSYFEKKKKFRTKKVYLVRYFVNKNMSLKQTTQKTPFLF